MTTDRALAMLLAWTSPSYPVGAFSYSHGLEAAVEAGAVRDAASLVDYVSAVIARGGGWVDAVLFARAYETWRGDGADDGSKARDAAMDAIAELAVAFRGSAETALESRQMGRSFLAVTRAAWPHPALDAFAARHAGRPVAHCIVGALACAAHGAPLRPALTAWIHGTAANLVSAGVRLVPLGQTDGQIATARLTPVIEDVVARAPATDPDDLGTSALLVELASLTHETQYTRLFRS
ncbi:urease accessory protein UreF [Sphingomonas profundi]|uniref:urease accessory protein UreF n=1 Tax=Alterirhizorhabdus profundi TaxID=2681549 RepID=UPI0012E847F5|nr:urease accessory protein UreF [Sphingomonas profundi]